MKRIIWIGMLLATLLTFASPAMAFDWGARAGVNFASLAGPDRDNFGLQGGRVGLVAGLVMMQKLPGLPVRLAAELTYSQQGARFEGTLPSAAEQQEARFNLDYINLAAVARVDIIPGPIKPYALVGAQGGFRVSGRFVTEDDVYALDDTTTPSLDGILRSTNVGMVLGAGARLRAGGMGFFAEVRYNRDLMSIGKERSTRIFNSVITLGAGVHF
jgi:opacity protein-like surface antigen